jgi:serine/threonine protein kinase/tetratricopeptide (TPR) repeat protein
MKPSKRPEEPPKAAPSATAGGHGEPEQFSMAMQFANTAVGDTALALSPSVPLTPGLANTGTVRATIPAPALSGEFGPYHIVRQVGAGGMGAVYEAHDRRSGARVAIKSLLRMGPSELHRFKYEFRSMAGVGHPNLVTLYELVSYQDTWCITMEYVEGVDLCTALRQRGRHPARLRGFIRQLAQAIQALHAHNLLHRDLKPSNVLVTAGDRVVVLDFGLVAEISRTSFSQAPVHAGTPLYMAPEQCASQLATAASDWYALGMMLYEAVVGRLPFTGTAAQIFLAKQFEDPPPPSVPEDPSLAALISGLLNRDPAERASGAHVLAWCDRTTAPAPRLAAGGPAPASTVELSAPVPRTREPTAPTSSSRRGALVGRDAERSMLEHAFTEASGGRTTSVYLRGVSGTGKTALGQRFLSDLTAAGEAVVLAGRCYEHESVPFKAFDSLIDALTDHLLTLPPEELAPLLGAHAGDLARVFPVLERIPQVKEAAELHAARLAATPATAGLEHESRRRAFAALKRLLYSLAVRRPLVLAVDDLHWTDVDSVRLLSELLAPPDAPPLLLLAAYRSDWPGSRVALKELEQIQMRVVPDQNVFHVDIGPLAPPEAEDLARTLLAAAGLPRQPWAAALAAESNGNAFLIAAAVQALARSPEALEAARPASGPQPAAPGARRTDVSLEALLAARLTRLDPGALALLELIAVAGQPVPADLLSATLGRPSALNTWLSELYGERLIFLGQRGRERSVECSHDRLREVVVRHTGARARSLHLRLARTAIALGRDDPEFLARHLQAAGDHAAAAEHAVRAAQAASSALAFDRAAELYQLALRSEPGSWTLIEACADAKVNAGRCAEAAPMYFKAAGLSPESERYRLWQKSCEQFFVSGETGQAIEVLRAVLMGLGLDYPESSEHIHRQFVQMVRALAHGSPAPELGPAPSRSLVAVDTLWAASKGFLFHSPLRGAYFAAANALLARELGDEGRAARGMAAIIGLMSREQEPELLDAMREQVARYTAAHEDPYVVGFSSLMEGIAASIGNRWSKALHDLEFGGEHLRRHCTGVFWECNMGMMMLMGLLEARGELRSIADRSAVLAQQAKETGNQMMEYVAAYYSALMLIAGDAIGAARGVVRQQSALGLSQELPAAHLRGLMIEVNCDLYAGDLAGAWERVEKAWSYYEQSRVLYARSQRINASGLRGQVALALARGADADTRERLLAVADAERRTLEGFGTPQAKAMGALLRAMAAAAIGRSPAAVIHRLHTAVAAFESADMSLHAACVSHRLGEWSGGEAGAALIARSEAFMRLQTIVRPQRWVAMVTPSLAPVGA